MHITKSKTALLFLGVNSHNEMLKNLTAEHKKQLIKKKHTYFFKEEDIVTGIEEHSIHLKKNYDAFTVVLFSKILVHNIFIPKDYPPFPAYFSGETILRAIFSLGEYKKYTIICFNENAFGLHEFAYLLPDNATLITTLDIFGQPALFYKFADYFAQITSSLKTKKILYFLYKHCLFEYPLESPLLFVYISYRCSKERTLKFTTLFQHVLPLRCPIHLKHHDPEKRNRFVYFNNRDYKEYHFLRILPYVNAIEKPWPDKNISQDKFFYEDPYIFHYRMVNLCELPQIRKQVFTFIYSRHFYTVKFSNPYALRPIHRPLFNHYKHFDLREIDFKIMSLLEHDPEHKLWFLE